MGRIYVKTKGVYKHGQPKQFKALVDGGADVTILNLATACRLGFNPETAEISSCKAAGGATLKGYLLNGLRLEANGRHAVLDGVFVPAVREEGQGRSKRIYKIDPHEETLLGHDFLQKSQSIVDYQTDQLRGFEPGPPVRLRPKLKFKRGTKADRELLRLVSCPRPKRR